MPTPRRKHENEIKLESRVAELEKQLQEAQGTGGNESPAKKLQNWEKLGEKYLQFADPDDLCDDGKEMLREVEELLGKDHQVTDKITLTLEMEDFEISGGLDEAECDTYLITIKDKNGKVIYEDVEPDDVDVN